LKKNGHTFLPPLAEQEDGLFFSPVSIPQSERNPLSPFVLRPLFPLTPGNDGKSGPCFFPRAPLPSLGPENETAFLRPPTVEVASFTSALFLFFPFSYSSPFSGHETPPGQHLVLSSLVSRSKGSPFSRSLSARVSSFFTPTQAGMTRPPSPVQSPRVPPPWFTLSFFPLCAQEKEPPFSPSFLNAIGRRASPSFFLFQLSFPAQEASEDM